eukprot:CAMPEP_0177655288 /NCGR_PEP_ID=MMETSP0447-20121125/14869_1 /TAXON_ID=0 /ORGANISM="Stygamoeba regulata, Strain BSH-02190019" /LENGTH=437 /DNA_ID=CAMNT_0019159161 /DNA_START=71 /DNA_END=1380 /DNA_ORIENTATION=+
MNGSDTNTTAEAPSSKTEETTEAVSVSAEEQPAEKPLLSEEESVLQDADVLRELLRQERIRSGSLEHDLAELNEAYRTLQENMQATLVEEEFITNTLLKRLATLKQERDTLAMQVEQEEEYLTNTLQRKLDQLKKEKIDLENALEQEEEYIVNRLQKQLQDLQKERDELRRRLEADQAEHIASQEAYQQLKDENFVLQQKVTREKERSAELASQKMQLEQDVEINMERMFNTSNESGIGLSIPGVFSPSTSPSMGLSASPIKPAGSYFHSGMVVPISPRHHGGPASCAHSPSSSSSGSTSPHLPIGSPQRQFDFAQHLATETRSNRARRRARSAITVRSREMCEISPDQQELAQATLKKKYDTEWMPHIFVITDGGNLLCMTADNTVVHQLDLDTITEIRRCASPQFALELRSRHQVEHVLQFPNRTTFSEWESLLR